MSKVPHAVSLLRVGNEWMVGSNVNRIVPLFAMQSFLAAFFRSSERLPAIRDLTRGTPDVPSFGCFGAFRPSGEELRILQDCLFAILAPDRRLFRPQKSGGVVHGSLTPILATLAAPTPSDDGLGKRMAYLLTDVLKPGWQDKLTTLFAPSTALGDPVSAIAGALLGTQGAVVAAPLVLNEKATHSALERHIAEFVGALIRPVTDARRLTAIQELGRGLYFGAIWLLIAGPLSLSESGSSRHLVFVYAGMPPGQQNHPLVHAASRSLQRLLSRSWVTMAQKIVVRFKKRRVASTMSRREEWEHRFRSILVGLDGKERQKDAFLEAIRQYWSRSAEFDLPACQELMSDGLDFDVSEFARRARSLGANIGFAGPDRGRALPRLYAETPLLGAFVRGVCRDASMPFETFVSEVRKRFGLVFGPGDDETLAEKLGPIWPGGEGDELLLENQEELRRRLVKVGLARTYSDAYTEVFAHG